MRRIMLITAWNGFRRNRVYCRFSCSRTRPLFQPVPRPPRWGEIPCRCGSRRRRAAFWIGRKRTRPSCRTIHPIHTVSFAGIQALPSENSPFKLKGHYSKTRQIGRVSPVRRAGNGKLAGSPAGRVAVDAAFDPSHGRHKNNRYVGGTLTVL